MSVRVQCIALAAALGLFAAAPLSAYAESAPHGSYSVARHKHKGKKKKAKKKKSHKSSAAPAPSEPPPADPGGGMPPGGEAPPPGGM